MGGRGSRHADSRSRQASQRSSDHTRRREQERQDEALAHRLMWQELNGAISSQQASCPYCGAMNTYNRPPGYNLAPMRIRCVGCHHEFSETRVDGAGAIGRNHVPETHMIHTCPNCGVVNQFPAPDVGAVMPNVQCGTCNFVSPPNVQRHHRDSGVRLMQALFGGAIHHQGPEMGPMVRIDVNGQRQLIPLRTLLLVMAQERSNAAESSDIRALPSRRVAENENLGEQKKCLICLEEFVNGDDVKTLPCLHIYHQHCAERWLNTDNSCPVCKQPIGR